MRRKPCLSVKWIVVFAAVALFGAADRLAAADQPAADRTQRGIRLRKVVVAGLEYAREHNGNWPEKLEVLAGQLGRPAASLSNYTYRRPAPSQDRSFKAVILRAVTVVVHEPFPRHPKGVWVGYADGHLEFVETAEQLEITMGDAGKARRLLSAPRPAATPERKVKDPSRLRLKVVDPEGQPVAGARLGTFVRWGLGDFTGQGPHWHFPGRPRGEPVTTDKGGAAVLPRSLVFREGRERPVGLYVLHQQRGLAVIVPLLPATFGDQMQLTLQPVCRVRGRLTSVGLAEANRPLKWTNAYLLWSVKHRLRLMGCESQQQRFEFLLPPGQYGINAYGTGADGVYRPFEVRPGQRSLKLALDLPPERLAVLTGKPAPELRQIKGWKNGGPVTLAGLKGKVVILDFWGHWCGPCVGGMPRLMDLHDKHADKGLVILAVHDDSVASVKEMEARIQPFKQKYWGGRDLPFLVALDGGGRTRIKGTHLSVRGATHAAYGIQSWPTKVLIDKNGILLGRFDEVVDRAKLEQMLEVQPKAQGSKD